MADADLEQMLDLAAAAGCDPDALHAVLGHLAAKGVFQEQDAEEDRARSLVPGQVCYLQMPAIDAAPGRRARRRPGPDARQNRRARRRDHRPPSPDGPTSTLATILDPEGNSIGLAGHSTTSGD